MKVKKFIASSMPEAMKQIREELGIDAVILNSKEIHQGGFLGLFKKRKIEVVAVLDPQPIARYETNKESLHHVRNSNEQMRNETNPDSTILQEIKYMKKILEQQVKHSDDIYLPDYQVAYQYLIEQEVEETLARKLIESVITTHKERDQLVTRESVFTSLQIEMQRRLKNVSFQGITYDQQIIQFVGPTGVGKTTTLAKIAANCMLVDRKSIAFITTDTYRIAAIEQLKTYARILDVPVEVAYTIEDYHQAIKKFAAYDLILVDTAGRNFRDPKYIKELEKSVFPDTKSFLVLSLTAKPNDIIDIYKQFEHISINEVIFTKLDETLQYGSMINIALNHQVGIAYVANGQDVPEDLINPNPKVISHYILQGLGDDLNE